MTSPGVRDHLLARIKRGGARVDAAAADALEQYLGLLARWNPTINLTSLPLNPPADKTFDRLFVEPIVAAGYIEPPNWPTSPVRWIDLGSGGGSPAIPVKIVRPSWVLTMVEAKERKASFLREAIRALRLQETDVANRRFEEMLADGVTADIVTIRAVKLDNTFAVFTRKLLKPDGILAVFSSSPVSLVGFDRERCISLVPQGTAVLTLLRVPRGT